MTAPADELLNALLASGFPFQTAVAATVPRADGWSVVEEEFPWPDTSGVDRFLDMVVTREPFFATVECKKTSKEKLIFLRPTGSDGKAHRARCLFLRRVGDSTGRTELYCSNWMMAPQSVESSFCVVSTSQTGKDQRLLERDAQHVIRGTDAFAQHHKRRVGRRAEGEPDRPYVPVLVTNAPLFVARYDPGSISLETGQLTSPSEADVEAVDWVRFTKAFTSHGMRDPGVRTVFCVRAMAFVAFLEALGTIGQTPSQEGITHLPAE